MQASCSGKQYAFLTPSKKPTRCFHIVACMGTPLARTVARLQFMSARAKLRSLERDMLSTYC